MRLRAWAKSDTGRRRAQNEDSFLLDVDNGLFAVADGMGGHQAGELASRLALESLHREVTGAHERPATRRFTEPLGAVEPEADVYQTASGVAAAPLSPFLAILRHGARRASHEVYDRASASSALRGMGTTLTAVWCRPSAEGGVGFVLHAGDSRLYRLREGVCTQLTEDHTWVAEQLQKGLLTAAEAQTSKFRHVITKSIGFDRFVDADLFTVDLRVGDGLLLCSDGLSNYATAGDLARLLTTYSEAAAPQALVDFANECGGEDNVTALLVACG